MFYELGGITVICDAGGCAGNVCGFDEPRWHEKSSALFSAGLRDMDAILGRDELLIRKLTKITEQVAEEHEENPALMVSRVKNYLRQTTESSPSVTTEDLSSHVFSESEELKTAFEKRAEEEEIPEEVVLPKTAAVRKLKNQRIRTDTGIELTFPTEYFSSPDFIEFTNHPDGTISIELKHIGKITNR